MYKESGSTIAITSVTVIQLATYHERDSKVAITYMIESRICTDYIRYFISCV